MDWVPGGQVFCVGPIGPGPSPELVDLWLMEMSEAISARNVRKP